MEEFSKGSLKETESLGKVCTLSLMVDNTKEIIKPISDMEMVFSDSKTVLLLKESGKSANL